MSIDGQDEVAHRWGQGLPLTIALDYDLDLFRAILKLLPLRIPKEDPSNCSNDLQEFQKNFDLTLAREDLPIEARRIARQLTRYFKSGDLQ